MGGDRLITDGRGWNRIMARPKIFRVGRTLIGASGDTWIHNVLRAMDLSCLDKGDLENAIYGEFQPRFMDVLKNHGYLEQVNGRMIVPAVLVVASCEGIYEIDRFGAIDHYADPYGAIGTGMMPALGAMFATGRGLSPRERIQIALRAAEAFAEGVRGPFDILSTKE